MTMGKTLHLKILSLLLSLIFLFPANAFANTHSLRFGHVSLEQGLPNLTILSQLQDSQGFMWFGTKKGLARYDGYDFKIYQPDSDDPFSISFHYINALHEDSSGYLWIATDGGGLNRFDPASERFISYQHQSNNPHSLSNDTIHAIESANDGKLWIATADGLNLFDPVKNTFEVFRHQPENDKSLSGDNISSILSNDDGSLWVGLNDGWLNWRDPQSGDFKRFEHQSIDVTETNLTVLKHYQGNNNKLWIGTRHHGLLTFDTTQTNTANQWQHYQHNPSDKASLSDNGIHDIFEDSNNRVWIGTNNGLNLYDHQTDSFTHYQSQRNTAQGLSDSRIQSITEDSTGLLWFGTWHEGLNVLDSRTIAFSTLGSDPQNNASLTDNIINTIYYDTEDNLWVGGNKGLNLRKKNKNAITRFVYDPIDSNGLNDSVVRSILMDNSKRLWIGTKRGGLNLWHKDKQQFSHYSHNPSDPYSLSHNAVQHIYQRSNGELWIATRGGLNRWDPVNKRFDTFVHQPDDPQSLSNDYLYQLYEDKQQRLWIASRYGGLNLWLDESQSFQSFAHQDDNITSLNSNFITAIHQDAQGALWVGTVGGGLNKGTLSNQEDGPNKGRLQITFEHFTSKQGLRSDLIAAIVADKFGILWISTTDGISRFDTATEKFVNFGGVEGAQPGGYLIGSSAQGPQGRIYFGGIKGITHFLPEQIKTEFQPPEVALTAFRLFNKPVVIDPDNDAAVLSQTIHHTDAITLNHEQSVFSFEFSALHYANPLSNQYAYQLQGFDEQWITTDAKRRYAGYTNLSAGLYVFRVRASNKDGVWNNQGVSLNITILPPWWLTWWAKTLGTILTLGTLYAIYRLRIKLLTQQRKILEEEVALRTHTLSVLSDIGKEISSSLNIEMILETVYMRVNKLMDATIFGIGIYQPNKELIEYKLAIENSHRYQPYTRDMNDKGQFAVWCIEHKEPVFINDVSKEYHEYLDELTDLTREEMLLANGNVSQPPNSMIYIPLLIQDRVLGVIKVQSHQVNAYGSHHKDMLQTLATYTATALENANTYLEIEDKNKEILAAQQQLIMSEKMASLGTMTAGVAHEINNPTNFTHAAVFMMDDEIRQIKAFLKQLAGGDDADPQVLTSFEDAFVNLIELKNTASEGTKRIKMIVEGLRTFTHLDATVQEQVHIAELIESTVHLVRTQYDTIDIQSQLVYNPRLSCFPSKLAQVLMNIIVNACQAIEHEQQHKPKHQQTAISGTIKVTTQQVDNQLVINIEDNGPGMDETTIKKVFEPFFTTKSIGDGTGLGMAISFGIVEEHGGTIEIDSALGRGTVMSVCLPVVVS